MIEVKHGFQALKDKAENKNPDITYNNIVLAHE